jgi:hypothetical protein
MYTWSLSLDNEEMAQRASPGERCEEEIHFIWVVWGENHIREALASARVCRAWNLHANPRARYFVYVLDDWHNVPASLLRKQGRHGVEVVSRPKAMPTNPALYDLDRLHIMAEHDKPAMYIDTDLYVLCPIPIAKLGPGIKTFGMGLARIGFGCNKIHGLVDEVLDHPSSIYYSDCGLNRSHFEANRIFWPWLRINMGQIWSGTPGLMKEFAQTFAEMNAPFAQTRFFGVGEMVFTAMHNAGCIPEHEFDWRNGWNKIWPFIDKVEAHAGVIEGSKSGEALGIYPVAHHDILHVGHFGVQTHLGWTAAQRPIQMTVLDDDSIELKTQWVETNRSIEKGMFASIDS